MARGVDTLATRSKTAPTGCHKGCQFRLWKIFPCKIHLHIMSNLTKSNSSVIRASAIAPPVYVLHKRVSSKMSADIIRCIANSSIDPFNQWGNTADLNKNVICLFMNSSQYCEKDFIAFSNCAFIDLSNLATLAVLFPRNPAARVKAPHETVQKITLPKPRLSVLHCNLFETRLGKVPDLICFCRRVEVFSS